MGEGLANYDLNTIDHRRASEIAGIAKSQTGIDGFDELTLGGLPTGRPTLVCGGAGCGKTLFASTFLIHGARALDEPVSHLDLHHQVTVLEHLRRLARERGRACLMSIHDLNLAARFCTHALVIGPGAKLHQGPAESTMNEVVLSAAFGHPVAAERFGERTVFVAD